MPWMNARADVICADLLLEEIGAVERAWPAAWDDALACQGWERWLITGRLASVRADAELEAGRLDDAVTWARRALEMARTVRRRKYEIASLITLGSALAAQGAHEEARRSSGPPSGSRTAPEARRCSDGVRGPPSAPPRRSGPRPPPRARPSCGRPPRSSARSRPRSLPNVPTDTWRPRRWRGSWTPRVARRRSAIRRRRPRPAPP